MFTTFQGGPFVEVFSPQGKDPTSAWKMCGGKAVKRVYEKSVKGYVYAISGGPGHKMQLPKDERKGLGLKQPYLVFQIYVPVGQHISFEVGVSDAESTRRRLFFSSSFNDVKATPLHCQVPLPSSLIRPGQWVNLALHMPALTSRLFSGRGTAVEFRAVESISVGAVCKLRKIFTLKAPPLTDNLVAGAGAGHPDVMNGFGGLNGGGLGVVGSHTGVVGSHLGVVGSHTGVERSVGVGGGVHPTVVHYHGVPLAALPEPIHRTVDFLLGVDRCTQVVDPAKLLECQVQLPSSGGQHSAGRGGGAGAGSAPPGFRFGSPPRGEVGGFGTSNGGAGGFDRPYTEQATRDGWADTGGEALAPIRKNGTAGSAVGGSATGAAGGGSTLHLAFGSRFSLQRTAGSDRDAMNSAGGAGPLSSRGGRSDSRSGSGSGSQTDRPVDRHILPPAANANANLHANSQGNSLHGAGELAGYFGKNGGSGGRGSDGHPGFGLPSLEMAAEALAAHALSHGGGCGGGANGYSMNGNGGSVHGVGVPVGLMFLPPGASSPRSGNGGGEGGTSGRRPAVVSADSTLASLGDLGSMSPGPGGPGGRAVMPTTTSAAGGHGHLGVASAMLPPPRRSLRSNSTVSRMTVGAGVVADSPPGGSKSARVRPTDHAVAGVGGRSGAAGAGVGGGGISAAASARSGGVGEASRASRLVAAVRLVPLDGQQSGAGAGGAEGDPDRQRERDRGPFELPSSYGGGGYGHATGGMYSPPGSGRQGAGGGGGENMPPPSRWSRDCGDESTYNGGVRVNESRSYDNGGGYLNDLNRSMSVMGVKQSYAADREGSTRVSGWMRDGGGGSGGVSGSGGGGGDLLHQPPAHVYSSTRYCDDQDDEDALVERGGSGRFDKRKPLSNQHQNQHAPPPPPFIAPHLPLPLQSQLHPNAEAHGAATLIRPSLDPLLIPSPGGYERATAAPVRSVRSPSRPEGFPSADSDGDGDGDGDGSESRERFPLGFGYGSNANVNGSGDDTHVVGALSGSFGSLGRGGNGASRGTDAQSFPRLSVDGDSEAAEELRLATELNASFGRSAGGGLHMKLASRGADGGGDCYQQHSPSVYGGGGHGGGGAGGNTGAGRSRVRVSATPTTAASEIGEGDDDDDGPNLTGGGSAGGLRDSEASVVGLNGIAGLNADVRHLQYGAHLPMHDHSHSNHGNHHSHSHDDGEDGVVLGDDEDDVIRLGDGGSDGGSEWGGDARDYGFDFAAYNGAEGGEGKGGGRGEGNNEATLGLGAEQCGIAYYPDGIAYYPDGSSDALHRELSGDLRYPRESQVLAAPPRLSFTGCPEAGLAAWHHQRDSTSSAGLVSRGGKETPIPGAYPPPVGGGHNYRAFTPELVVPSRYTGSSRRTCREDNGIGAGLKGVGDSNLAGGELGGGSSGGALISDGLARVGGAGGPGEETGGAAPVNNNAPFHSSESMPPPPSLDRAAVSGGYVDGGFCMDGGGGGDGGNDRDRVAIDTSAEHAACGGSKLAVPPPPPGTADLDLIYDPILNFYYDPKNGKYYELM